MDCSFRTDKTESVRLPPGWVSLELWAKFIGEEGDTGTIVETREKPLRYAHSDRADPVKLDREQLIEYMKKGNDGKETTSYFSVADNPTQGMRHKYVLNGDLIFGLRTP